MIASATVIAITKYNAISSANISLLFFFNFSIACCLLYRQMYIHTGQWVGTKIVMIRVAFVICTTLCYHHITNYSAANLFTAIGISRRKDIELIFKVFTEIFRIVKPNLVGDL